MNWGRERADAERMVAVLRVWEGRGRKRGADLLGFEGGSLDVGERVKLKREAVADIFGLEEKVRRKEMEGQR